MPKVKKEFNKAEYDKKYHKERYKNLAAAFTKAEAEQVEAAAESAG